jgi:hypothetical protein
MKKRKKNNKFLTILSILSLTSLSGLLIFADKLPDIKINRTLDTSAVFSANDEKD